MVPDGTIHLFIPPADPKETMWSVAPPSMEQAKETFEYDGLGYTTDIPKTFQMFVDMGNVVMHILPNTTEFPARPTAGFDIIGDKVQLCDKYLLDACQIARIKKDPQEIELIREANRISSRAHEVLMKELGRFAEHRHGASGKAKQRDVGLGLEKWEVESEGDAEALFVATCRRAG